MRGAWGRVFIEPFEQFKWWVVRVTTPWHEEAASLDLAWRVFARKHNTAGKRPICHYDGWEADLDPDEKADVYEFPNGDPGAPPNCLIKAAEATAHKQKIHEDSGTGGRSMSVWNNVLIQVGEFRLVKGDLTTTNDTIIQHHCDNTCNTIDYYCDPENNWWYCWCSEQKCSGCGAPTPPEMRGFKAMCDWER